MYFLSGPIGSRGRCWQRYTCVPSTGQFRAGGRLRSVDGAADSGEHFAGFRIIRPLGAGGMGEVYSSNTPGSHARKPSRSSRRSYPRIRVSGSGSPAKPISPPNSGTRTSKSVTAATTTVNCGFRWPTSTADAARLLAQKYPAGMPAEQVIPIVAAVASALDYAHGQGTLHRDVKPANIFVSAPDPSGENRVLGTSVSPASWPTPPDDSHRYDAGHPGLPRPEQLNGDPPTAAPTSTPPPPPPTTC